MIDVIEWTLDAAIRTVSHQLSDEHQTCQLLTTVPTQDHTRRKAAVEDPDRVALEIYGHLRVHYAVRL